MATADPLIHPVILLPTMSQSLNVPARRRCGGWARLSGSSVEYGQAREYHTQALTLARHLGDRRGEAEALWGLGHVVTDTAERAAKLVSSGRRPLKSMKNSAFRSPRPFARRCASSAVDPSVEFASTQACTSLSRAGPATADRPASNRSSGRWRTSSERPGKSPDHGPETGSDQR